mmetsp:Transcript_18970/g.31082  ORF Transcript_18970/g.31082 Transcript_18970/m.31082 type:complete len:952 (+) Transcript_18970:112-2967(+)
MYISEDQRFMGPQDALREGQSATEGNSDGVLGCDVSTPKCVAEDVVSRKRPAPVDEDVAVASKRLATSSNETTQPDAGRLGWNVVPPESVPEKVSFVTSENEPVDVNTPHEILETAVIVSEPEAMDCQTTTEHVDWTLQTSSDETAAVNINTPRRGSMFSMSTEALHWEYGGMQGQGPEFKDVWAEGPQWRATYLLHGRKRITIAIENTCEDAARRRDLAEIAFEGPESHGVHFRPAEGSDFLRLLSGPEGKKIGYRCTGDDKVEKRTLQFINNFDVNGGMKAGANFTETVDVVKPLVAVKPSNAIIVRPLPIAKRTLQPHGNNWQAIIRFGTPSRKRVYVGAESTQVAAAKRGDLAMLAMFGPETKVDYRPPRDSDFFRLLEGEEGKLIGYRNAEASFEESVGFVRRFRVDGTLAPKHGLAKYRFISQCGSRWFAQLRMAKVWKGKLFIGAESTRDDAARRRDLFLLALHGPEYDVVFKPTEDSDFMKMLRGPAGQGLGIHAHEEATVFVRQFRPDGFLLGPADEPAVKKDKYRFVVPRGDRWRIQVHLPKPFTGHQAYLGFTATAEQGMRLRDMALVAFCGLDYPVDYPPDPDSDFMRSLMGPEGASIGHRCAKPSLQRTVHFVRRFRWDGVRVGPSLPPPEPEEEENNPLVEKPLKDEDEEDDDGAGVFVGQYRRERLAGLQHKDLEMEPSQVPLRASAILKHSDKIAAHAQGMHNTSSSSTHNNSGSTKQHNVILKKHHQQPIKGGKDKIKEKVAAKNIIREHIRHARGGGSSGLMSRGSTKHAVNAHAHRTVIKPPRAVVGMGAIGFGKRGGSVMGSTSSIGERRLIVRPLVPLSEESLSPFKATLNDIEQAITAIGFKSESSKRIWDSWRARVKSSATVPELAHEVAFLLDNVRYEGLTKEGKEVYDNEVIKQVKDLPHLEDVFEKFDLDWVRWHYVLEGVRRRR